LHRNPTFRLYIRKSGDNPQIRGVDISPLNAEVRGIEPQVQEGKAIYPLKLECHDYGYICSEHINK
jgi:hypothetical protein